MSSPEEQQVALIPRNFMERPHPEPMPTHCLAMTLPSGRHYIT